MAMLVLTVEDTFQLPTIRGLVVVPGPVQAEWKGSARHRVELRKPDGSTCDAMLTLHLEFTRPRAKVPRLACVLEGLRKDDVPIGTEVWLLEEPA